MSKVMRAIGLMSGTSMDGIDVALIETDGEAHVNRIGSHSISYDPAFRDRLRRALVEAKDLTDRNARPGSLAEVESTLTERHASEIGAILGQCGLESKDVDVIGFHGQTVLHRPEAALTIQLGDGPRLAAETGIDVVYDLRAADVAAGGQGAPLAPVYHKALVAEFVADGCAVLNIGGVANVTFVCSNNDLVAFDTGPGNALIDEWMLRETGIAFDRDGCAGCAGQIDEDALSALLDDPYFAQRPPKSLDREAFDLTPVVDVSKDDAAATLAAFTAETIARSVAHLPKSPGVWVVCGGGRHNRAIMQMLGERLGGRVLRAEEAGVKGDVVEAEAWAYLAVRSLKGLPITFPGTTGVARPMTGGVLVRAR